MVDIATLGLRVDSTEVAKAERSLDQFSGAAASAEKSAVQFTGASKSLAAANDNAARSVNAMASVLRVGNIALGAVAAAFALVTFGAIGLTTKLEDINEAFDEMGISKADSVRQAFDRLNATMTTGAFGQFAEKIKDVVAVLAYGALEGAIDAFNSFLQILPTIAEYAAVAGAALLVAFSPAIIGAVMALGSAISGILIAGLLALGAAILTPAGALAALGVALYALRDTIQEVFGVDIIASAKSAANQLIGLFVTAFDGIKFIWANLPNVIGAAAIGAVNLAISAVEGLVNKSIDGMNKLISAANVVTSKVGIDLKGAEKVTLGRVENPYADALKAPAADFFKGAAANVTTDYLGNVGKAFDGAKGKARAFWKAAFNKDDAASSGGGGAQDYDPFSQIVERAEARIRSLEAERQAIGLSAEAAARLRYETDLLNMAQRAGIELTAEQTSTLQGLAAKMASTEAETKALKEQFDFAKSTTRGFFGDLKNGLQQGKGFWASFADAASKAIDKITNKLLDQLVDALFQVNGASGASGGGGGLFGGLFSGFGKIFSGLFGFASGGYTGNMGVNSVAGIVHGQEYVVNAGATKQYRGLLEAMNRGEGLGGYMPAMPVPVPANGNGQQNIHVTVGVSADSNGNLMPFVESVSMRQASAAIRTAAPSIVQASQNATKRSMPQLLNDANQRKL